MTIKRRLYLSLIEVSVAFGLMAIILFVLFSSFRTSSILSNKIAKVKEPILQKELCYQRLLNIFSKLDTSSLVLSESGLTFAFKNDLDPEFCYSGEVKAHLLLEKEGDLILEVYSAKKEMPPRIEKLLANVASLESNLDKEILTLSLFESDKKTPYTLAFFLPKTSDEGINIK